MSEIEIIKLAMNAGYLALSFTIIFMIRDFARGFAGRLLQAVNDNTAQTAKLCEKIESLKGPK
jgi:hypothetical protein